MVTILLRMLRRQWRQAVARLLGAEQVLIGSRPAALGWLQHSQQQVFNTMLYRPASEQQPERMDAGRLESV